MPNTFELIASSTVGAGGAASIDFTSIPSTYTDLCLKLSLRHSGAGSNDVYVSFNSSTANFTGRYLEGTGSGVASSTLARFIGTVMAQTASTFTNGEVYIPNYAGSTNKSFASDFVAENNATLAYSYFTAGLWSNTAAINAIGITPSSGNWVQYSTAYLYGVKNA